MKNKAGYDVVVAGHVCLDIAPRFIGAGARDLSQIIKPGMLVNVDDAVISTGGAVSNTGLSLLRLGIRSALMGKTGNDFFGAGIRSIFKENGADSALSMVDGEESSYSIVLAPPGFDRMFLHHPGANDTFCADDIDYEIVSKARLFHFGYPPLMKRIYENDGAELIEIFRRVKKLGKTTSLDMSLPDPQSESGKVNWSAILSELLPLVDIAPLSIEEIIFMLDRRRFDQLRQAPEGCDPMDVFGVDDFSWAGRELLERGAGMAMIKCGCRGVMLYTGDGSVLKHMGAAAPEHLDAWIGRELWEESFLVDEVASASGAGDSAIAGFLAGLLRGTGPEQALSAACCAGAQNVRVLDATSGIHSWEETIAMIPGWKKRREQPGADWRYNEANRIWHGPSDPGFNGLQN